MKSRNKEKEKNKLINELISQGNHNHFNNSNNGYIKVNKANEYNIKNKNKSNKAIHLKSKSFICNNKAETENNRNNRTINIVDNIKNNKYLMPMVQNKNIEKKLCREKLKDAPLDIMDILSKVRQKSEKNRKESRKVIALLHKLEKEASTLVYINQTDPIYIYKVYEEKAEKMGSKDMMVIYGIYLNKEMKQVWQQLVADDRSGITFDLYDVGIILFDKKITKQDYIVNF